jgi:hypothetical protein
VCHEVGGKSIIVSCATQKIPVFRKPRPQRVRFDRGLEKRGIITYVSYRRRLRRYFSGRPTLLRAVKAMGIQEFVLISGSAPAAGTAASVAHEAIRAAAAMKQEDESELRAQLGQLRQEHRDLDVAIEALHNSPGYDLLQVQRLKKRKLHLRDRIIQIEDQLTPDIIA